MIVSFCDSEVNVDYTKQYYSRYCFHLCGKPKNDRSKQYVWANQNPGDENEQLKPLKRTLLHTSRELDNRLSCQKLIDYQHQTNKLK